MTDTETADRLHKRSSALRRLFSCFHVRTAAYAAVTLCVLAALQSCASVRWDERYVSIDRYAAEGDFTGAHEQFMLDSADIYGSGEETLRLLDEGMLLHYAQEYKASNDALAGAERAIYENYAKSVSQAVGSALINDTIIDYAGDPYEDIYTNVFMALNYIHLGMIEDAFVEIRRFDNKLRALSAQYQAEIAQTQQEIDSGGYNQDVSIEFHNSALARYISMLLYRSRGDTESARVDRRLIDSAFQMQGSLYPFDQPASLNSELAVEPGQARLNIFAFSGRTPIKREQTLRLLAPDGSFYFKIALPELEYLPSAVHRIEAAAVSQETGEVHTAELELLEDISLIAGDTFRLKQGALYFKSIARSLAKSATGAALSAVAGSEDSSLGSIVMLITSLTTEATERADLRISRYFPAKASVGGLTLEPGAYTVEITYKDSDGSVIERQSFADCVVRTGELNILETQCLR